MLKKVIGLVLLMGWVLTLLGAGIYIEPGASLTYVKMFDSETPGKPLRLVNVNSVPMVYDISIISAEQRLKGYLLLPDTMWVRPIGNHFKVEPWDTFDVPILISIPEDKANYNRAWACELSVIQSKWTSDKAVGKAGAVLQLGANATWLIETPTQNKLPDKGTDPISVSPGIWSVQYGDSTENKVILPIKIRNDDDVEHTYTFESYIPDFGDSIVGMRLDIFPLTIEETGWIFDPSWIRPKPKKFLGLFKRKPAIKLKPGEEGEYPIIVDLPPTTELGDRRYEGVILIRQDGQSFGSRFTRYIITPGREYNADGE